MTTPREDLLKRAARALLSPLVLASRPEREDLLEAHEVAAAELLRFMAARRS
jgi:hypothetical protein